jgi:hypothetical protein
LLPGRFRGVFASFDDTTVSGEQDLSQPRLEKRPIFWFYGSAAMAYGIKNNAFSYLLLIYANQVLGIPGYLASLALAREGGVI